jgi:benzoyl-CoA reductase subunit B
MAESVYRTRPLDCWRKAKELREQYFRDYVEAKDKGGIRWSGGSLAFGAITAGLGDDVHSLAIEPYAAAVVGSGLFATECLEAVERAGFAHDICSYTRNYWGSILLDRYAFGGKFPRPDFRWQMHNCCTHSKCDQVACYLEGGDVPAYSIDMAVGHYSPAKEHKVRYIVDQMHDGIEWLEKVTGRKYSDEKLIEAVHNECRTASLWAEICIFNKNTPSPLDEKTMFSLQVLSTLKRHAKEVADFYQMLKDEVEDRVANGIAAVPVEKRRLISTNQPPWAMLKLFRYLEEYGAVSVGSLYTFGLMCPWDVTEDWSLVPTRTPKQRGIIISNREEALQVLAELNMKNPNKYQYYDLDVTNRLMLKLVEDWHIDGVMMHLNRGCELFCLGVMETRRTLLQAGVPVMTYEGSSADERDLDEAQISNRVDSFMESLELKQLHQ